MMIRKKAVEDLVQKEVSKLAQGLTDSMKRFQSDFLAKTDSIQDLLSKKMASDLSSLNEKYGNENKRIESMIDEIEGLMKDLRASSVDSINRLSDAIELLAGKKKPKPKTK